MGEPLSLAVNMIRLVINAFTASRDVYNSVQAISNAPKHIKAIAGDLEDLYSTLGSLKGFLEDVEISAGVMQAIEKVNISRVIENCLQIFTTINLLVNLYNSRGRRGGIGDMSNWRKIKYSFKITEIEALRSHLVEHKITLNIAISMVNLINLNTATVSGQRIETEITNHMRELEEKLPAILSRCLEDAAADALPRPEKHSRSDKEKLLEDYDFTIRRYLDCASSIGSECNTPDTASIQISTLGTAESLHISTGSAYFYFYETAKTHISEGIALTTVIEDGGDYEEECTQIFVKGPHVRTTVLQVEPNLRIWDILHLHPDIRYYEDVFCRYGGQVLNQDRELRDYQIPHNSTIFYNLRVIRHGQGSDIFIKILAGKTISLRLDNFEIDGSIAHMRRLIQEKEGIPSELQRILYYRGRTGRKTVNLVGYGLYNRGL